MVSTSDVLRVIGKDGVVTGSVARGCLLPKDVDVVIKERGQLHRNNPVFSRLQKEFGEHFASEGPGHCYVKSRPLYIECFEYSFLPTEDQVKDSHRTNYRKAKRHAVARNVFGVDMLVEIRED